MGRSRVTQVLNASQVMSGRAIRQAAPSTGGRSITAIHQGQPSFVSNLINRLGGNRVPIGIVETDRSGDIRSQDIDPRSITDIQIKEPDNTIHLTIGKYDGTNFGLAAGSDTDDPDLTIDKDNLTINTTGFLKFASGSRFIMWNPADTDSFQIGYVLTQFQILSTTDTQGIMIGRNVTLGDQGAGTYGGGSRVVFIGNNQVAPSTNPSNGGLLYVVGGALTWRGSSGTVTPIAPA